jgi:hypothetical protein
MANPAPEIRSIWPYRDSHPIIPLIRPRRDSVARRGIGLRAATRFPVLVCEGPHVAHCSAVELSATGIVIDRGRELSSRELRAHFKLELMLPEQRSAVRVLARIVRQVEGARYAFKFVLISDADRLTLMEHVDRSERDSRSLLEEVARAGNG